MKAPRNLDGQPLTRAGTVDKRHSRHPRAVNGGNAYTLYSVVERPNDSRPWHVVAHDNETGVSKGRMSRHTQRQDAEDAAERLRVKEPDRKPSRKLKHKLRLL